MVKEIVISQGKLAQVSDEDYCYLMRWNWYFSSGYAHRQEQNNYLRITIMMHDVVAQRMGHDLTLLEVDHKDRNGLNNTRENLDIVTHSQNMQNRTRQRNNTSGHRGVGWFAKTGKWRVEIVVNKRNIHIGYFASKENAIAARKLAESIYFGREID